MGMLEGGHVLGGGVDGPDELLVLAGRVAERLDPTGGRTRPDDDEDLGPAPDLPDLLLLLRRGD